MLCNNLEGWDGVEGRREVQEGWDTFCIFADERAKIKGKNLEILNDVHTLNYKMILLLILRKYHFTFFSCYFTFIMLIDLTINEKY